MRHPGLINLPLRLCIGLLLILLPVGLFSQEAGTCAEKLKNAQSSFEKGQVDEVPGLIQDCLKSSGFKKEESLTAYKLLIQTLLLEDKLSESDTTMFEFLQKNPEYQLSPTDHSSFVYLFNKFQVKPVIQLSLHVGFNVPFLTFVTVYPTAGEPGTSNFNRKISNLFISVESKFKISPKMEAGLEIGYSQLKFGDAVPDFQGFTDINYNEAQQRIELPLNISYDLASFGKFTLYSRTGLGAAINIGVKSTATYNTIDANNPNRRTGEVLPRKDSRVGVDFFGQIGAGIKFKISRGFLFGEARSNFGVMQQNVENGNTVEMMQFYYLWRDPNFRLNALNINFGYTLIFYKPEKRK